MRLLRYLTQYRIRDMVELVRNDKAAPKICSNSMEGKTVVISGATSGIGLSAARLFASRGARLICLNRNPQKTKRLEEEIRRDFRGAIGSIHVDFSSLDQIRECAHRLMVLEQPIDVLIHNAGVFYTRRSFSADGIEMVFQVNHLSSFLLNHLLSEKLISENRARIIYVNSEGHRFALGGVHLNDLEWKRHLYTGLKSYGAAKTAQLLTMLRFDEIFSGSSVTINAMHPGNVVSNIGENNGRVYRHFKKTLVLSSAKDPGISAQALYYLSASEEMDGVSGKYFNLTTEERPAPHGRDRHMVGPVWHKSLDLCGT